MNPFVVGVQADDRFALEITFQTGERRRFDLTPYLNCGVFARLADPELFRAATVVAGSVEWPGGIDLSYDTLYTESTTL